jgi:hypothetical protein
MEVRFSAHSSSEPELTFIYFVLYSSLDYHNRANIHPFIHFISGKTSLTYDLRSPINTIAFRAVSHSTLPSDLTRFACEPPVPYMCLIHVRLPWYIDVQASNPTGVTLADLFGAIWACLRSPIVHADFWNEELSEADRDKITKAWRLWVAFNHMVATKAELCCIAKAIDRYIQLESEDTIGKGKIDPRLQKIIEGIFRRCIKEGEYKQVSIFHSLYC